MRQAPPVLAIDAGRCLLLERDEIFCAADEFEISIIAVKEWSHV